MVVLGQKRSIKGGSGLHGVGSLAAPAGEGQRCAVPTELAKAMWNRRSPLRGRSIASDRLGVPHAIRHPLLPRDDAGSLGSGSRRCTTRLPLSLRCRPPCAQGHRHSGRRMASCRRRGARNTGANGTPSRGRKSRPEPLRRPSTGLGTPPTAAAYWPTALST